MIMLSSSSPVTATHDVRRPLDPGALEHEELRRVARASLVLELRLERARSARRAARSASPRARCGAASARGSSRPSRRLRSGGTSSAAPCGCGMSHDRTASVSLTIAAEVGQTTLRPRERRTPPAPGRGCGRRRCTTPNCFCAIWPITMLGCRRRSRRRPRRRPRCRPRAGAASMPWPTMNSPVQSSPSRPSASSRSSITVTSQPAARSCFATAEPTRPQPTTITFTDSA